MPFSLFSVRYAAQLRQRSFRTPLPTGIQGTKTHRQAPKMGPQPARARKRMRNGKRKIDRMARCERRKKKPEKMPRGKDNGSLCSPACFSTNAARDLGQFSARFGTLFFAFFPCWHSICKARRNFSPGFLCCSVPRAVVIRYTTFGFPVQGQAHIPRSQIQRAKNPCSASLHGQCKVFRILWALKR